MGENLCRHDLDRSLDDLESVMKGIDTIPSMSPKLNRIGAPKPQNDRSSSRVSVVEIGFRHFQKGELNFREYDLYE